MKRFFAFLSCVSLLLLAGCHEDPFLTVNPSSLSFAEEGGSQTIQVSANYAWTASVSGSGFKISPASGEGVGSVTVTASAATSADEVTGSVSFQSEGLSASVALKQSAKTMLEVGSVTKIPQEGGTITVDVRYNTEFTVEIESAAQSWISFAGTKSLNSGKLEFSFTANDGAERTGKVTVKDKNGKAQPQTLTFVQEEEKKVIKVGETPTIPAEGGTFTVDVEYNTDLQVEVEKSAQSWITFIQTKALKSGKLEFSFKANEGDERTGKVTVKDKNGKAASVSLAFTQKAIDDKTKIRNALMAFYNALDGPNWKKQKGWGKAEDLNEWEGVIIYGDGYGNVSSLSLNINGFGLKGKIPESIGDLAPFLTELKIQHEPGLVGTLPASFAKLTHLEMLDVEDTALESLPDCFGDMKSLSWVWFFYNKQLTGPLPESLGSSDKLYAFLIQDNHFTGTIPASWARLLDLQGVNLRYNRLSGKIPQTVFQVKGEQLAQRLAAILQQDEGYGFDISNVDIPGYWPQGTVTDFEGRTFTFADVVAKNDYTVYLTWATWCPYSVTLLPSIKEYYEKYRQDGLEIIATIWHPERHDFSESEKTLERNTIREKGYDQWYNFFYGPYYGNLFIDHATPNAEVYDKNGNVLFSSVLHIPDPVRKRFEAHEGDLSAYDDLIPFLESVLGPLDAPVYTSTDFSQDGKVLTLQKASVGKGINIVFLGDGYSDKDMASGGLYETLMKQAMEEFFAIEPYKTFRNRFNVYAVKAVSTHDRIGAGYTTAFGTTFGNGTETSGNLDKCYEYALKAPGVTKENLLIPVMVNTRRNAGTARMSQSLQSSVAFFSSFGNHADAFAAILQHEAGGHGFAFLADEYSSYEMSMPEELIADYQRLYEQYGWYANVDFTNDPKKIRWSAFLSDSRYKDEVGIYQGGALYATGVWRPTENSMMNEDAPYFNAPSRWAIYQRIMKLSGETPSFDAFLEYDAVNRGAAATKAAETSRPPYKDAGTRRFEPTAPPVILP